MNRFIETTIVYLSILFTGGIVAASDVKAQVVINEFSSNTSSDWVEIYSSSDVDISEWKLRDSASSVIESVPQGTSIGPSTNKFYVIEVGTRLNQDGDTIKLLKSDDTTVVDQVSYNDSGSLCLPTDGGAIGRNPDGSSFTRFSSTTKGLSNSEGIVDQCPSPTPIPTNTPTPTDKPSKENSPTPTNKPDPTSSPLPTSTLKPTKKVTPTTLPSKTPTQDALKIDIEKSPQGEDVDVNNLRDNLDGEVLGSATDRGKFPTAAFLFIGSGICFISAAGYLVQKKRREESRDGKLKGE